MPPTGTRAPRVSQSEAKVAAVDDRQVRSPAAAAGAAAFNRAIDTTSLAEEVRSGKLIPGVDPTINTLESVPYRQYISRVLAASGVTPSALARQLCSHICGFVAALPMAPSKTEMVPVGDGREKTEYDVQVDQLAAAADAQVRGTTGNNAVALIGPARRIARAALDLRLQDPDGAKGVAWVNKPFEVRGGQLEPDRFGADGMPTGVDANTRERMAAYLGEDDEEPGGDRSEDLPTEV